MSIQLNSPVMVELPLSLAQDELLAQHWSSANPFFVQPHEFSQAKRALAILENSANFLPSKLAGIKEPLSFFIKTIDNLFTQAVEDYLIMLRVASRKDFKQSKKIVVIPNPTLLSAMTMSARWMVNYTSSPVVKCIESFLPDFMFRDILVKAIVMPILLFMSLLFGCVNKNKLIQEKQQESASSERRNWVIETLVKEKLRIAHAVMLTNMKCRSLEEEMIRDKKRDLINVNSTNEIEQLDALMLAISGSPLTINNMSVQDFLAYCERGTSNEPGVLT